MVLKNGSPKSLGRISLDAVEDRAWLGALIVGEGSIFNKNRGKSRQPTLSIKMCDRSAVAKAARLMGIGVIASERVATTGRRTWCARATCARALQVIALAKPFLTSAKIEQARATIAAARSAGFRTREEMRIERKLRVLETVRKAPGSFTTQIRRTAGCGSHHCMRYLVELKKDGTVMSDTTGSAGCHRIRWFPINVDPNAVAVQSRVSNLPKHFSPATPELTVHVEEKMLTDRNGRTIRKGLRGKRGSTPMLGETKDRAWAAEPA